MEETKTVIIKQEVIEDYQEDYSEAGTMSWELPMKDSCDSDEDKRPEDEKPPAKRLFTQEENRRKVRTSDELREILQASWESDDDFDDIDIDLCETSSDDDEEENYPMDDTELRQSPGLGTSKVSPFIPEILLLPGSSLSPGASSDEPLSFCPFPNPSFPKIPFTATPGLKVIPLTNTPIEFFRLYFTEELYKLVLEETNRYGIEFSMSSDKKFSRMKNFNPVSIKEFDTFIGLFFHMGNLKFPKVNDYWRTDFLYKTEAFFKCMSRNRFLQILRSLHFVDYENSNDRLGKVRSLLDFFNDKTDTMYEPNREISIDEAMLLWRGRSIFRQFIKGKRHKYGIKLYMLCETNGLILKFLIYMGGTDTEVGEKGHAEKVVQKLLEGKLGKGYSLYMNNFYSSVPLVENLLRNNTYCTGTLKPNRKGNPQNIMQEKLKKGDIAQAYTDKNICVMKWHNKKVLTMLSSEHRGDLVEVSSGKYKPDMLLHYNKYMGGVDRHDQIMSYYSCQRKTLRWYRKIGLHIFQMMLLNSYFLFRMHTLSKISYLKFREEVIMSLLGNMTIVTSSVPRNIAERPHLPRHCPVNESGRMKKRKCRQCRKSKKRVDSSFYCPQCPEEPGLCLHPCFPLYHRYELFGTENNF